MHVIAAEPETKKYQATSTVAKALLNGIFSKKKCLLFFLHKRPLLFWEVWRFQGLYDFFSFQIFNEANVAQSDQLWFFSLFCANIIFCDFFRHSKKENGHAHSEGI